MIEPVQEQPVEDIHNFTRKLQHPDLRPTVLAYLKWRREYEKALSTSEAPPKPPSLAPLSINLDLTTACNFACDHCIDWDALNKPVRYDEAKLFESLDCLMDRGLQSVILLGGGEPTLHPAFERVVRHIKGRGLQLAVVSNGSRNAAIENVADAFTDGDWVRLSLDAGTEFTFRSMHKPKDPNLSLQSIVESAARIKQKNEAVSLGFSFVITWKGAQRDDVFVVENLSEMAQAAKLAKAHRFDYISFKPFLMRASQGAEVLDASTASDAFTQLVSRLEHQLILAGQHQDSAFKVVASTNLTGLMSGAWEDFTKQPKVCHVQALRQVVSPLGVFNCPAHRGVAKARIGSADAWASGGQEGQEGTQRILDSFHACNECAEVTCLYHRLNSTLDKLISSDVDMDVAFPAIPGPRDTFL